jgi:hypothetical protein
MRCADGVWEYWFGGQVSARNGAFAELVISADAIEDKKFRARVVKAVQLPVLPVGAVLRVVLQIRDTSELSVGQAACLIKWNDKEIPYHRTEGWVGDMQFVEVTVAPPTGRLKSEKPGLWLNMKGANAVGLSATPLTLPGAVSKKPAISLNHAFTKLSEVFEAWRISHTGNVYSRVLYKEANGQWYPLSVLRNAHVAEEEQKIAHGLWAEFIKLMTPAP